MKLTDSIKIFQNEIENIKVSNFKKAIDKLNFVLKNNPGFKDICLINQILDGKDVDEEDLAKIQDL